MRLVRTSAPATPIVSLADLKAHLRVDHTDENDLITALGAAAVEHLDGARGWLGRALNQQSYELRLDDFCSQEIRIPLPPLISVDSIKYYTGPSTEVTLSNTLYEVSGIGDENPGTVRPIDGVSWPTVHTKAEAVTITFTAGYVTSGSPSVGEIPAPIIHAIKLLVGHWYANRETVSVGVAAQEMPFACEALLSPLRVHHFA